MSIYEAIWENGLQPEIIDFSNGLNWLYIIMMVIALYGEKHTHELDWFKNILNKIKINKYHHWMSGIVMGLFFVLFKYLETGISWSYVSSLLRSLLFSVVFSNIFVDIPVVVLKKLGKIIDQKDKGEE